MYKAKLAKLASIIIVAIVFFSGINKAEAMVISKENAIFERGKTINEDLFITGERVVISGKVVGDVYGAGANVVIDGEVTGDVSVAGGSVRITGKVGQDLQVAGRNVVIYDAIIGGSLRSFGGSVSVDDDSKIAGSAVFGAGTMELASPVGRGITGGAGGGILNSRINGPIRVGAGSFEVGPKAVVTGPIFYSSEDKILIDPQASVSGQVKQILPDNKDIRRTTKRGDQFANLGFHVWSYFAILLIGVLLLRVSPTGMTRISERILKNPLPLLTWGVVALFLTVPILILIAMTIIGIPLAVLLLVIF